MADISRDLVTSTAGPDYYLVNMGKDVKGFWTFNLPVKNADYNKLQKNKRFKVEIIDVWAMTVTEKRCFVMAKKAGATDSITLTGGCAKNDGLKKAIEKVLKIKVVDLSVDPQLMGALGAAECARQKGLAKSY